jgi:DnaK suppressor protein
LIPAVLERNLLDMEELSKREIEALGARLRAYRAELAAAEQETAQWRGPVELDQQSVGRLSRMDAMQQQAMAEAEARRRQAEIMRIDAALKRIGEGEYGWCLECGEAIAPRRLEIDPAASRCIGCAA